MVAVWFCAPGLTQAAELTAEQAEICGLVGARGLECFVWYDTSIAMTEYEQVMVTDGPTSDLAFAPFFLMPRYQAAIGQPGFAFQSITEWLEATAGNEFELWDNPTGGLHLTASQIAADPLPAGEDVEPADALAIANPDIRGDALIETARLLARAGETARAGAMFARAIDIALKTADSEMWHRDRHLQTLFAMWAKTGPAINAMEAAGELSGVDSAFARLSIVEGLALTGDANATANAARALPGWLPLMGEIAVAEAYRRQGHNAEAKTTLDGVVQALVDEDGPARRAETYRRLAQGYALLGETITAERLMMADVAQRQLHEGLMWTDIAPMIACHDLLMALRLVTEAGAGSAAVVDVLIAASASGGGRAAYQFALDQPDVLNRALYLLATAIGLRHGTLADDPGLPCATVTVIGR